MALLFERLAVIGVGLIGGSLAWAAKRAGLVGEVVGCGRGEENLRIAAARGIIDRATHDPAVAVERADAVLLAVPVETIRAVAERSRGHLSPGAVVTDVASVKATVVAALEAVLPPPTRFVGSHPIAGSERAGAVAAQADLFRGARCVLTPTGRSEPRAVEQVRTLWEGVGAEVEEMSPETHDELLALTSHMPHVVAYALIAAVAGGRSPERDPLRYAGGALRDMTRVAASSPQLWREILLANGPRVLEALAGFRTRLGDLEEALRAVDASALEKILAAARRERARLPSSEE